MFELINKLFSSYNFSTKEISEGILFFKNDVNDKEEFWFVTQQSEIKTILEKQPKFFEDCKLAELSPSLDKNISMLVLWDTMGDKPIEELKNSVMSIEENAFYFKKYILYFNNQEITDFEYQQGDKPIKLFLEEGLANEETFKSYKEDALSSTWISLLYRMVIKIPFVKVNIGVAEELELLLKKNEQKILEENDQELTEFHSRFFDTGLDKLLSQEIEAEKILDILMDNKNGN